MEHEKQKDPVAQSTSVHSTTSAVDFSKETLVVKEEETYDAGVFVGVEAEVVKLLSRADWERAPLLLIAKMMCWLPNLSPVLPHEVHSTSL